MFKNNYINKRNITEIDVLFPLHLAGGPENVQLKPGER